MENTVRQKSTLVYILAVYLRSDGFFTCWAFLFFLYFFIFLFNSFGRCNLSLLMVRKGKHISPSQKGGETMDEPKRTQWQIRCAFNGYCRKVLKNESINAFKHIKHQQKKEVTFSNLTPQEENQLHVYDTYFKGDEDNAFHVAGKKITPQLLASALQQLPEDKRNSVLLHYFFYLNDVEISEYLNIPRSTVQYRRTSALNFLKKYLEEHANECDD